MIRYIYILTSFVLICLSSCKKEENASFGNVEYYPSFLWVKYSLTPVTKTFDLEFSQDAKDYGSYAEFQLVDNEGKVIGTDIIQVVFDGKECHNNLFRISSDMTSQDITFTFSPNARSGKYQGYLKLVSHNLDRLDSQPLTTNQQMDVLQWTLNFDKKMNPLAKVLAWLLIIIVSSFVTWLFILKPYFYPEFGKFNKSIIVQKEGKVVGQFSCAFKGARKVVLANQKQEQSTLNKLLTGRIMTIVNPLFEDPIIFIPIRKRKALVKGTGYFFNPNPISQSGKAEINSPVRKINITLN